MSVMLRIVVLLAMSLVPVFCWGPVGHNITAVIAQSRLTSIANATIAALLPEYNASEILKSVVNWPDHIRDPTSPYVWSNPLHYVNTPPFTCSYQTVRDCPLDAILDDHINCVVGAIHNYTKRLNDITLVKFQQAEALKFLTHFVGDLHQPLHVGFKNDSGGNAIVVQYNNGTYNLHSVWDTTILVHKIALDFDGDWHKYVSYLQFQLNDPSGKYYAQATNGSWLDCADASDRYTFGACSDVWAQESAVLACNNVENYTSTLWPTPIPPYPYPWSAYEARQSWNMSDGYYDQAWPVVELRLVQASVRLAAVLNAGLSDPPTYGPLQGLAVVMLLLIIFIAFSCGGFAYLYQRKATHKYPSLFTGLNIPTFALPAIPGIGSATTTTTINTGATAKDLRESLIDSESDSSDK